MYINSVPVVLKLGIYSEHLSQLRFFSSHSHLYIVSNYMTGDFYDRVESSIGKTGVFSVFSSSLLLSKLIIVSFNAFSTDSDLASHSYQPRGIIYPNARYC